MNTSYHVIPAMQQEAAGHMDATIGEVGGSTSMRPMTSDAVAVGHGRSVTARERRPVPDIKGRRG